MFSTPYWTFYVYQIYTGEPTKNTLPIVANEDSNSLLESIYSTKKVKRKTMRVVISSIQQHLQNKILTKIHHVKSKDNIADVFTKAGVNSDRVLNALQIGSLLHKTEEWGCHTPSYTSISSPKKTKLCESCYNATV